MPNDYTLISKPFQRVSAAALCALAGLAFSITAAWPAAAQTPAPAADNSVVVLAYQRVGEDNMPQASLATDQFAAQMQELQSGAYTVLPLAEAMTAVREGKPLPPRSVVITFDGAYQSMLANAVPLLDDKNYPYTVFYNSEAADQQDPGALGWDDLKKLARNKNVTLGILPAYYAHMTTATMAENTASINKAIGRYHDQFGADPQWFAWPYGEYSLALKNKIGEYAFTGAFGLQSGVVDAQSDTKALPRFAMNDLSGDIDHFKQTASALPLPIKDLSPEDPLLHDNPPMIGFTVSRDVGSLDKLSCFISSDGKVAIRRVAGNRVELRPEKPFTDRRTRVNCTLPAGPAAPGEDPRWRWLGLVFVDPEYSEEPVSDTTGFE